MSDKSSVYDKFALKFYEQYTSTTFSEVHKSWKSFWPLEGDTVLDVGAGIGRDALRMSELGADVYAVEPSKEMLKLGKKHTGDKVTWLSDCLPSLSKVINLGVRFDVILLSGVWMHIPSSYRERAFRKLSNLLAPNGKLVISLRYGDFSDNRISYGVSETEIDQLAKHNALLKVFSSEVQSDTLSREDVRWQTIVLSLPDDGTGDLTKIRHVIVNDNKTATYKLALLRTLLRIADAHPGAVIDRHDRKVVLPVGLVALYWIRQYKRLLDKHSIQQMKNGDKKLGFVREKGWSNLSEFGPDDLSIGSIFLNGDAEAIQQTIKDCISTIKDGPVTYTYQGDRSKPYFQIVTERVNKAESIVLDLQYLSSFGTFILDESFWECLRIYHSWIEPLVINQWVTQMRSYKLNQSREITLEQYHACLAWHERDHDTKIVRKRVSELVDENSKVESIWSGKKIKDNYHVDHCLPFAYWPNNDRWNLFPVLASENLNKSDRLPSLERLKDSRERILNWWELAWGDDNTQGRFFNEATLSLPNIPPECRNFEDVFEAMSLQVRGVKKRLLVSEW